MQTPKRALALLLSLCLLVGLSPLLVNTAEAEEIINEVYIEEDAPVPGTYAPGSTSTDLPTYKPTLPDNANYYARGNDWFDAPINQGGTLLTPDDVFSEDGAYPVQFTIFANDGFMFNPNGVKIFFNGREIGTVEPSPGSEKCVKYWHIFDLAAENDYPDGVMNPTLVLSDDDDDNNNNNNNGNGGRPNRNNNTTVGPEEAPKTGDNGIFLFSVMLAGAAIGTVTLIATRRKEQQ